MSHVTASGVWREKGEGVTSNGFWGLGEKGKGVRGMRTKYGFIMTLRFHLCLITISIAIAITTMIYNVCV